MNGIAYLWKRILNYFHTIIGTESMGTTATTVKGAIAELNSYSSGTITGTYIDGSFPYEKSGNICIVTVMGLKNLPNGATTIGTMPVGFRPGGNISCDGFVPTSSGANRAFRCTISSNGNISIHSYGSAFTGTINVRIQLAYVVRG